VFIEMASPAGKGHSCNSRVRKVLVLEMTVQSMDFIVSSSSSSISLSRDRSIASSKLSSSVFGERLSRKSYNVVVFPFAFHIVVQQPLKPLWTRLLLCDHEPSQPSTVLCFMSLLMSLLPASGEFFSEFPSPRVILSFFPHP
jgi:hypothetical protein